jgi:dissimilatory sulfite reductase (desulfoviridin) alpha/beta subunit
MVEYHGEFFDFDKLQMSPAPSQRVPIYVGGHTDVALARAARVGDGWTSAMMKFDDLVATMKQLDELLAERGRIGDPFEIQAVCIDRFGLDGYREQRDAGITDAITVPWLFYGVGFDGELQAKKDGIRRFADEIINRM